MRDGFTEQPREASSLLWIAVQAFRGGAGPNASGFLFINGGECPFDTWDCSSFWGWGEIPASDVSGSFSRGEFAVHTDLRTNPAFYLEGADPGIVSVNWQRLRDGLFEGRNSGSREFRWDNLLWRFGGTSRYSSAAASGEVLGVSLDRDWTHRAGSIESGKGSTVELYVNVSS